MTDERKERISALESQFAKGNEVEQEPAKQEQAADTTPADEDEPNAAPEGEVDTGDSAASDGSEAPEKPKKKNGLNERFSELTQKRKDAERLADEKAREAEYWRQEALRKQAERQPQQPPAQAEDPSGEPTLESCDFDVTEFNRRHYKWMREQERAEESKAAEQRKAQERHAEFLKGEAEFIEQHPDYEQVAKASHVPITPGMAEAIYDSENPHAVAYYLGQHLDEAAAIAQMTPIAAARALGRIDAKVSAPATPPPSPPRTVTKAPGPYPTVAGTSAVKKDAASMDFSDHVAAVREQHRR